MSATGRGAVRAAADFYPTPSWCVDWLLDAVPLPGGRWLEPAAGDGAVIRAVNARRSDVVWHAHELREECRPGLVELCGPELVSVGDFLGGAQLPHADVVLTNPPFSLAERFLRRSLDLAPVVAFLLRLNWLGSRGRYQLFQELCPDVYVLSLRPSFAKNKHGKKGTDACEYGWFVWDRRLVARASGSGSLRVLGPLLPR